MIMLTCCKNLRLCRTSWSKCVRFLVIISLAWKYVEPARNPIVIPRDALRPHSFTNNQLKSNGYYRYMTVDEADQVLYVGAQNYVYRLDLTDIRKKPLTSAEIPPKRTCKGDPILCQNHIRFIVKQKNVLFACGTGGQTPIAFTLNSKNLTKSNVPNGLTTKCPYNPDHNSTLLVVEKGNPNNIPMYYYGFPHISVNNMDAVIARIGDLNTNTERQSALGLKAPVDFVGSFEWGGYVYFWYREVAVEFGDGNTKIYARVARVCKNDSQTEQTSQFYYVWFTYVKARLKCTIPDYKPNAFDYIQDVLLINDTFYATFATNSGLNGGLDASAICEFDVKNINKILDTSNLLKLMQGSSKIEPLPDGSSDLADIQRIKMCNRTADDLKNSVLLGMTQDYLLTEKAVEPGAIFYTTSSVYRKLAVQKVNDKTMYYLATNRGNIYKLVKWFDEKSKKFRTHLLAKWVLFNKPTLIWSLKLYGNSLYIGTDSEVLQLSVDQCSFSYDQSCHLCVRDPHCGWNTTTRKCQKYAPGLLQDISKPSVCPRVVENINILMPGNAANLPCKGTQTTDSPVTWYRNGIALKPDAGYLFTKDDGLIIINVTLDMRNNTFICQSIEHGTKFNLVEYKILMADCEGSGDKFLRCEFMESYKKWKAHFDLIDRVQDRWKCIANKFPSCTNKDPLPCGAVTSRNISPEISNEIPNNR